MNEVRWKEWKYVFFSSIRIIQIVRFFLNALKSLWREDSKRILFFLSLSFSLLSHCHSQLIRQFIRFVSKKQCNETSIFNHRNEFSSSAAFFYAVFFSPWKFELCDLIYYEGKTNTEAFISEHLDGSRFVSFRISIDPRKKRTNKKKFNHPTKLGHKFFSIYYRFLFAFWSINLLTFRIKQHCSFVANSFETDSKKKITFSKSYALI